MFECSKQYYYHIVLTLVNENPDFLIILTGWNDITKLNYNDANVENLAK